MVIKIATCFSLSVESLCRPIMESFLFEVSIDLFILTIFTLAMNVALINHKKASNIFILSKSF